jgi:hypothetical protein
VRLCCNALVLEIDSFVTVVKQPTLLLELECFKEVFMQWIPLFNELDLLVAISSNIIKLNRMCGAKPGR